METKICTSCKKELPLSEFHITWYVYKGKKYSYHRNECKRCVYIKNQNYRINRRKFLRKRAIEYLGGKCQMCGYDKEIRILEFHHKTNSKEDAISNLCDGSHSWEEIKKELDKCELLCPNCHALKHLNYKK